MDITIRKAKPFRISKRVVFEAYKRVKANQGAAGVDEESIADFDKDLKNNLYKIRNRMSSGSYCPPCFVKIRPQRGRLWKPLEGDTLPCLQRGQGLSCP